MSKILISNKMLFTSEINNTQFEINKKYERKQISKEEKHLLDCYLNGTSNITLLFLYLFIKNNPEYKPKLDEYLSITKNKNIEIGENSLEVFKKVIESETIDRKLSIYRGTSKKMFSATTIIDNNALSSYKDLKTGSIIQPLTVQSASLDPFTAALFLSGSEKDYLFIEYELEPNEKAFWANPFSEYKEKELILPPQEEYEVQEITHMDLSITDKLGKKEDINYIKIKKIERRLT